MDIKKLMNIEKELDDPYFFSLNNEGNFLQDKRTMRQIQETRKKCFARLRSDQGRENERNTKREDM